MNKEDLQFFIPLILIIVIILFTACLFIITELKYNSEIDKMEKDYYKEQMLSFCKLSEIKSETKYPEMYPCEKWLLKEKTNK